MSDGAGAIPNTRALLAALSGGAIDWDRVEGDVDAVAGLIQILETLWEFPVQAAHPASVFSAAWEDLPDDA